MTDFSLEHCSQNLKIISPSSKNAADSFVPVTSLEVSVFMPSVPHRQAELFLTHRRVTWVRMDGLTGAVLGKLIFPPFIFTFVKLYFILVC